MIRPAVFMLVVLAAAFPAGAQPSVSASVAPGVTSISGAAGEARFNASVAFDYLLKSERVRLTYDFDRGDFATAGDWRFVSHVAGASYRFDFGKASAHHLYAGTDATLRRNGDSWAAADFNGGGAFMNLELHPGRATVRTGYRVDARRFPSSPALDQLQHTAFASVLASFETRTTLIGEAIVGAKHYDAVSARTEVVTVASAAAPELHRQGAGRGAGLANLTLVPVITPASPGSDARHVTVMGRIAQSLAARTGLSFEASRRHVSGEVAPALVATPASFFDDGIYDDLFASDATRAIVTLKSIVVRDIEVVADVEWLRKDYPATTAFDEDGVAVDGLLRNDRVRRASVDVVVPLFPSRTGAVSLELLAGYAHAQHRSTSALYRYSAHALRFGIGLTY
jgi:hypothetical protein